MGLRDAPLLKRLVPSLVRAAYGWRVPGRWTLARRSGLTWLVTPRNHVDRRHLEPGGHEPLQRETLIGLLDRHPPDLFFDIGANFGLYSLVVAQRYRCPVWAFEPDPRNFMQLGANVLVNGLEGRIAAIPRAVSRRSGRIGLVRASDRSTGRTRTAPPTEEAPDEAAGEWVDAVAIDALDLPPAERIAAKIDVEGAEDDVIAGMTALLSRSRGVLQIEILPGQGDGTVSRLRALGYAEAVRIEHDRYFVKD